MALKSDLIERSKLATPDDQKKAIFERLGDLEQYDLLDDQVLLGVYVPCEVLASGIDDKGKAYKLYGTDNQTNETRWQGKIGCVVKMGPTAFKYMPNGQPYEGSVPMAGDWVIFHAADSNEIFLRGAEQDSRGDYCACRRTASLNIKMRVKDPRTVR
jgi:hypothetical protein